MAATSSSSGALVVLLGVAAAATAMTVPDCSSTVTRRCREDALRVVNAVYGGSRAMPCLNSTIGSNKCPDLTQTELHDKFDLLISDSDAGGSICATKFHVSPRGHVHLSCGRPCRPMKTTSDVGGITVACYHSNSVIPQVTPKLPK